MSDVVAVAVITGLVGLAGSVVTYFIARHQGAIEFRKLELDRAESNRQKRERLYHEWLEYVERYWFLICGGSMGDEERAELWRRLSHLTTGVKLFGSMDVAAAAESYSDLSDRLNGEAEQRAVSGKQSLARCAAVVWLENAESVDAAAEAVYAAMRNDLG